MISLKSKSYTSNEITHTNSSPGTIYNIQHNFGRVPDSIELYVKTNGLWRVVPTMFYAPPGDYWGWFNHNTLDINISRVDVRCVSNTSGTDIIKISCFLH